MALSGLPSFLKVAAAIVLRRIHPTNRSTFYRIMWVLVGLAAILLLCMATPIPPGFLGISQSTALHTFLEMVAIAIAVLIFAVGIATQRVNPSFRVRWIAILFFGVAVLDFSHVLSFQGMPEFVTPAGVEKTINFWLAARLLTTLALLGAALIPQETKWSDPYKLVPGGVLASIIGFHVWFLFYPETVPRTFVPGEGLTAVKNGTEYVLIAVNAAAAVLLFRRLSRRNELETVKLFGAAVTSALAGYFFTRYAELTDAYILLGHIYKIIAYSFLYRGVFVGMVLEPYGQLQNTRNRLEATVSALPDMLVEVDEDGVCQKVYGVPSDPRGISAEGLIGQPLTALVHQDSIDGLQQALDDVLTGSANRRRVQVKIGPRYFSLSIAGFKADAASRPSALILARDTTERAKREAEITKLTSVIDNSPFPIIITDAKTRIEYVNRAFTEASGYSREEAQDRDPGFIDSGLTSAEVYKDLWSTISQGRAWHGEFINRRKDGQYFTELAHIFPILGPDGEIAHYMAYKENITERKAIEQQLEAATRFDQLTGLPNRALVETRFQNAIDDDTLAETTTVMVIDIDNFRVLNDALGWGAGDAVLKALAMRLQEAVGPGNTLARLGSDEFIALFPSLSERQAGAMAQRLLDLTHDIVTVGQESVALTYSIGIARYPDDGLTFDALSVNAEVAMHAAKAHGRNRFHFFATDLQAHAMRRHDIGNALRSAVDLGQFHLVFQPKLSLRTGECIGAEALLRWTHPTLGVIGPAEFIPIAEEQGSIDAIGDWVIGQVFKTLTEPDTLGSNQVPISINLSAIQLNQPDLVGRITQLARAVELAPGMVEFELTEAAALKDPERAPGIIRKLHEAGFSISLDDFGTGYSSFQYLRSLEVQRLKLDRLFVSDVADNAKSQAIAEGIIRLAHALGMVVIAEGIETAAQRKALTDLGCDEIQGYVYSKPLLLQDFISFVKRDSPP